MDNMKLSKSLGVFECEISDVLVRMAKTTEESKSVNCGGCGFKTCEQMVVAIILGMRTTEDCVCSPSLKQEIMPLLCQTNEDMLDSMNALLALIDLKENESLQLMESLTKILSELSVSRKRINTAIHFLTS
jgi:hypothetical protein